MLMTTLLPSSVRVPLDHPFHALPEIDVPLGGRGMYATFLRPASHKCILPLLRASMEHHIHSCITTTFSLHDIKYWSAASEPVARAIEYIIDEALARLTLMTVRPRSLGWTMALRRLLHDRAVDYVVLDGLSDGFWPERWAEESGPRRVGDIRAEAGWRDTWDAITALRRDAGAVVVITTHGLRVRLRNYITDEQSIPNTPFYKPHLPPPFPSPWVQRFDTPEPPQAWGLSIQITLLGRMRSLQFPAETTLVDALRARKDPGGEYAAIVRVPHTPTEGRFSFGIAPHGLVPFTKE